jgi:hypothetical protein
MMLTYARRYALFALVGIAGEDDLDAPDLDTATTSHELSTIPSLPSNQTPGKCEETRGGVRLTRDQRNPPPRYETLDVEASAALCSQLLSEIEAFVTPDDGVQWASNALRRKNSLQDDDALAVEAAFEAKLTTLRAAEQTKQASAVFQDRDETRPHIKGPGQQQTVVPRRKLQYHRNRAHLEFIRSKPCVVCGRQPADAHHIRFAQPRALGRKVSDEFTIPLCRTHHREAHRSSNEAKWWRTIGISPLPMALQLWQMTMSGQGITGEEANKPW